MSELNITCAFQNMYIAIIFSQFFIHMFSMLMVGNVINTKNFIHLYSCDWWIAIHVWKSWAWLHYKRPHVIVALHFFGFIRCLVKSSWEPCYPCVEDITSTRTWGISLTYLCDLQHHMIMAKPNLLFK
jgi:hypothetical protein